MNDVLCTKETLEEIQVCSDTHSAIAGVIYPTFHDSEGREGGKGGGVSPYLTPKG